MMAKNTSLPKVEVNRKNALASTGPKTAEGKAVSRMNATKHGLVSRLEVLPSLEKQKDWQVHLGLLLADLNPVGHLESILVERLALLLWRLARVARYEREVTAIGLETVTENLEETDPLSRLHFPSPMDQEEDSVANAEAKFQDAKMDLDLVARLPKLPDTKPVESNLAASLLNWVAEEVGVEIYGNGADVEFPDYPDGADLEEVDWTADHLRRCLSVIANHSGEDLDNIMAAAVEEYHDRLCRAERKVATVRVRANRIRRQRILPGGHELDKVTRYESHLERSLYRVLHELQRLQSNRMGQPAPPPAVLDVDVSLSGDSTGN